MMSRICVVTHYFLPHLGGIEKVAYEQSRRLAEMGYEMTVLTSQLRKEKTNEIDGIRVLRYPAYHSAERFGVPLPIPKISSGGVFKKAIKECDLVHAHGHPYVSSHIACRLARKFGKPFILTQHNTFINYESWLNLAEHLNDFMFCRHTLRSSDKVIAVSKKTLEYVLRLGTAQIKTMILYNGVDIDRFRPINKQESRRQLDLLERKSVVLTVRRLVYKNSLDTLIDAASSIIPRNPDILFVIVGRGPNADFIKKRIKRLKINNNVILKENVSDEDLPLYYGSADMFVLSSRSGEGFPLTVLEAMASGLPVIATSTGGTSEAVRNEINGILVPPKKPNFLTRAIIRLISSEEERRKMRSTARKIVEEEFTWEKNVRKLRNLYDEFLQ